MGAETKRWEFWTGCASGFAVAAGLLLVCFAISFEDMQPMLRQFRGPIPPLTRVVTHPIYLRAVPAGILAAVIVGNLWIGRIRWRFALATGLALLGLAAVVIGYYGATLPMRQVITDGIR